MAFIAGAALLALALLYAVHSLPDILDPGDHLVSRGAPGRLDVGLDALAKTEDINNFLKGPRPNPFSTMGEAVVIPTPPTFQPKPVLKPPTIPPPPPPVVKPPQPKPVVSRPQPWQVPVDFRGIVATEAGDLNVLLKIKATGENRRLVEGDIWPETGLRIVKITQSSVLLENDKGERFLMRDTYGSKLAPPKNP
ncbi:MAG TPA: hypothetical protein PK280_16665 [Planctomycetota bacterium]|nr:hypothetical protein [Planctomycetota bacterium]